MLSDEGRLRMASSVPDGGEQSEWEKQKRKEKQGM